MTKTFFVAGTDTGVGKSLVTASLLSLGAEQGHSTMGLKPLAAGCEHREEGWRNEDAELLAENASVKLDYQQINPVALKEAMAPHLAAAKEGRRLGAERLVGFCRGALIKKPDLCFIEGAGGWRVPLNPQEMMSDFAKKMDVPVILVVGVRLGCLNHALLSAEAITRDGLKIAGWVASSVDPDMVCIEENVETLAAILPFPLLGHIPHLTSATVSKAKPFLDISKLLESVSL